VTKTICYHRRDLDGIWNYSNNGKWDINDGLKAKRISNNPRPYAIPFMLCALSFTVNILYDKASRIARRSWTGEYYSTETLTSYRQVEISLSYPGRIESELEVYITITI
jgi:hypothetical protein